MSSGPYRLKEPWVVGKGGTFVRNEHWDPRTDPIRQAYPDEIHVTSGLGESTVIQRLLNQQDDDAYAVSWVQASPTLRNQAGTDLQARLTFPYTGNVDYLAVNMRSKVMSDPAVRKALSLSTNRATYVTATGGEGAGTPTWSVLSPTVDPESVTPPPGLGVEGDPEGARKLLQQAGVTLPVPLRVVYARSVLGDKAYAALAAGWERAGFKVELTGVPPEEYYETIEKPTSVDSYDVFRGVWTPDWPSAGGVLPALFDPRINIDSSGPGQDVGYFSSDAVNALIDKADATADPSGTRDGVGAGRPGRSATRAATSRCRRRRPSTCTVPASRPTRTTASAASSTSPPSSAEPALDARPRGLPCRRLLFVHAHPDDETLTCGIAMAHHVARGDEVHVLTCTLGEEGEVIPPGLAHLEGDPDDRLGPYRHGELTRALDRIGAVLHVLGADEAAGPALALPRLRHGRLAGRGSPRGLRGGRPRRRPVASSPTSCASCDPTSS